MRWLRRIFVACGLLYEPSPRFRVETPYGDVTLDALNATYLAMEMKRSGIPVKVMAVNAQ